MRSRHSRSRLTLKRVGRCISLRLHSSNRRQRRFHTPLSNHRNTRRKQTTLRSIPRSSSAKPQPPKGRDRPRNCIRRDLLVELFHRHSWVIWVEFSGRPTRSRPRTRPRNDIPRGSMVPAKSRSESTWRRRLTWVELRDQKLLTSQRPDDPVQKALDDLNETIVLKDHH